MEILKNIKLLTHASENIARGISYQDQHATIHNYIPLPELL